MDPIDTPVRRGGAESPSPASYWELSRRLTAPAFEGKPLREFVAELSRELLDFTGADGVCFRLHFRGDPLLQLGGSQGPLEEVCDLLLGGSRPDSNPGPTARGTLVVEDSRTPFRIGSGEGAAEFDLSGVAESLLFLPFGGDDEEAGRGLVALTMTREVLRRLDVPLLQEVAQDLALAFRDRHAHASLRERMKELNCLYRMALVVEQPHTSADEVLQGIVDVLPEAWLYPGEVWVRLEVGGAVYVAGSLPAAGPRLRAEIVVRGERRGSLAVGYAEEKPGMDEGPFLAEERALLGTVAREVALILEREEITEATRRLQEQLQHADRLATIGALAAGIGHELNDPLNNVLGYAQLVARRRDLPEQVLRDVETISTSARHARDVIRQLLLFARRMPQRRAELDLNDVVADAYPFLQALCASGDVRLERDLAPALPAVSSDPDQMRQVLVNLVVNASQAVREGGGRVTISTRARPEEDFVELAVEDTGPGMSEEVQRNAFLPFYTTRQEGTGLGLPVVHGIVTAHGGTVQLHTAAGRGTRFEVLLPAAGQIPSNP